MLNVPLMFVITWFIRQPALAFCSPKFRFPISIKNGRSVRNAFMDPARSSGDWNVRTIRNTQTLCGQNAEFQYCRVYTRCYVMAARQENIRPFPSNGTVNTFPRKRIHATVGLLWETRCFLCGPCRDVMPRTVWSNEFSWEEFVRGGWEEQS
jgi:hypothetical protein